MTATGELKATYLLTYSRNGYSWFYLLLSVFVLPAHFSGHLGLLQQDSSRSEALPVAQLRTDHSPLLAAYLHRIGRRDSATCPHCNGADETAEHLVLHCPAHDQARWESWPNLHCQSDPRRIWSFLERIGAVTHPPDRE